MSICYVDKNNHIGKFATHSACESLDGDCKQLHISLNDLILVDI